jgi:hypothetical protein
MPDSPPYPETGEDSDDRLGRGAATGTPRWVKVSAIVVLILVLMVVVMLVVGGNHGPGRH